MLFEQNDVVWIAKLAGVDIQHHQTGLIHFNWAQII